MPPTPIITEQDLDRLSALVSAHAEVDMAVSDSLQQELDRAVVVEPSKVSATVVTMNSRVLCRDARGRLRQIEIVYPRQADPGSGRVSVLAPLGRALLGAVVGDKIEVPGGAWPHTWSVEAIRYQPEAAGDFHL